MGPFHTPDIPPNPFETGQVPLYRFQSKSTRESTLVFLILFYSTPLPCFPTGGCQEPIISKILLPEKWVRPFWPYPRIPQRPKPEIEQWNRSKTARKKMWKLYKSQTFFFLKRVSCFFNNTFILQAAITEWIMKMKQHRFKTTEL